MTSHLGNFLQRRLLRSNFSSHPWIRLPGCSRTNVKLHPKSSILTQQSHPQLTRGRLTSLTHLQVHLLLYFSDHFIFFPSFYLIIDTPSQDVYSSLL